MPSFSKFMNDNGYADERWWAVAKANGVWKGGKVTRSVWTHEDESREKLRWKPEEAKGPVDFGLPSNLRNHPVVGMSWYEALAFTEWLTARWRAKGWLAVETRVQLPNEPEWEKAARGGLRIPLNPVVVEIGKLREAVPSFDPASGGNNPCSKRRYPWGDEPDPNRANYRDSRIGATSAVGCFWCPNTPYGCEDMAGNVVEWTRSLWGPWVLEAGRLDVTLRFPYPYNTQDGREDLCAEPAVTRVLRGGDYSSDARRVRCAFRDYTEPADRDDYVGFRVVVSPLFSER